jgi:dTDP-4-amino-4,6-dideoxygalactose transaminase
MDNNKIYLSHPDIDSMDLDVVSNAMISLSKLEKNNFISDFESSLAKFHQVSNAVLVSSGTSAIHLALIALKIGPEDKVVLPTTTFAATAFPILYNKATPVFIDIDPNSWTIDLVLLEGYLKKCSKSELPKAILVVDLFGRTCDYDKLFEISNRYEIPVIIDAAESLGSKYKDSYSASLGNISILSFNLNKIITTTGGGAILTNDNLIADSCRKLANQARDDVHWYQHSEVGFNYRISPLLAALGLSQFKRIEVIIEKRRWIQNTYKNQLNSIDGINIGHDSPWEKANAWLSTIQFDSAKYPNKRDTVFENLNAENIESRFTWKPLHMQPIFIKNDRHLNGTAEKVFIESLCLPSSNSLNQDQIEKICNVIKKSI